MLPHLRPPSAAYNLCVNPYVQTLVTILCPIFQEFKSLLINSQKLSKSRTFLVFLVIMFANLSEILTSAPPEIFRKSLFCLKLFLDLPVRQNLSKS